MAPYLLALPDDREERMFYMQQLGMSLRTIGRRFDITPERVRQLLLRRERRAAAILREHAEAALDVGRLVGAQYNPRTHAAKAALSLLSIAGAAD